MKRIIPAVLAGFLLAPHPAGAQGYPGLLSPQAGYTPPPAHSSAPEYTAPAPAEDTGSAAGGLPAGAMPFTGTGANTNTGYASVSGPAAGQPANPAAEQPDSDGATVAGAGENSSAAVAGGNSSAAGAGDEAATAETPAEAANADNAAVDHGEAPPPQNGYAASFAPKNKDGEDPTQAKNIYDMVRNSDPANKGDQQRRRVEAQVLAAQQAQQEEIGRANAEAARRSQDQVQSNAEDVMAAARQKQEDAESGVDGGTP